MFDPITLEVMWNRLITIAEEAENTLVRTSFSTVISEARDFACVLLDARGRSIAQARMTIPEFTLTLPVTVSHCLQAFETESFAPGDVIITNDPWMGSGHLSDVNLVRPLFFRDKIVGYFGVSGHVSDFGGLIGYHSGRDHYEEGLHIPYNKLYRAGEPDQILFSLIEANVRVPDLVLGDIAAMASALQVGERRVVEFLEDAGLEDLSSLSKALGERARGAMQASIRELPEGTYKGEYEFDGYKDPLTLRATVSVRGDEILVDYAGTSPEVREGAINAPLVISRADTLYFFQYILTPGVPTCSALFDPIRVQAPPGCLVNPQPPVAVKARSKTTFHIPEVLFNALAPVLPEIAQAGSGHSCYVIINGRDGHGRAFNSFYLPGGGMGATHERDGFNCTLYPTNTTVTPIEVLELTAPVLIAEKRVLCDSGGPGRFRGGAGQRVVLRNISDRPLTLTLRPEDKLRPPVGLLGGEAGTPNRLWLDGEPCDLDLLEFQSGSELRIHLPGGGGFGPAHERPPELVALDVREALVSLEAAREDYAVILEADTFEVDSAGTDQLRQQKES